MKMNKKQSKWPWLCPSSYFSSSYSSAESMKMMNPTTHLLRSSPQHLPFFSNQKLTKPQATSFNLSFFLSLYVESKRSHKQNLIFFFSFLDRWDSMTMNLDWLIINNGQRLGRATVQMRGVYSYIYRGKSIWSITFWPPRFYNLLNKK